MFELLHDKNFITEQLETCFGGFYVQQSFEFDAGGERFIVKNRKCQIY